MEDLREVTDVPGYIRQNLVDIHDFLKSKSD